MQGAFLLGDAFMKQALRPAFTATVPVLCGYLFIGFAFGVMLRDAGFAPGWAFLSSLTIYAGSGQYLLVSLLAANASLVTVAVMTLLLNCRHIFYGLSFLEQFREMGKAMPYMVFSLTDETYSLLCSLKTPENVDPNAMRFLVALLDQSYWIFGSVIGAIIGGVLPFDSTGIDFAMTALFVVIFIEQWKSAKRHLPAFIGLGCAALSLAVFGAQKFIMPALLLISVLLLVFRQTIESGVSEA